MCQSQATFSDYTTKVNSRVVERSGDISSADGDNRQHSSINCNLLTVVVHSYRAHSIEKEHKRQYAAFDAISPNPPRSKFSSLNFGPDHTNAVKFWPLRCCMYNIPMLFFDFSINL